MPGVEIAGGGLAGLVSAIAFAQFGWTVRLHEQNGELRALGAGIFLWDNGLRILNQLGLEETLLGDSCILSEYTKCDPHGAPQETYRFGPQAGTRAIVTRRQVLHDVLHAKARALGVEIVCGDKVTGADPSGMLHVRTGSSYKADLVVGADGLFSKVRSAVATGVSLVAHSKGAIRVLIPARPGEAGEAGNRIALSYASLDGRRRLLFTPCDPETIYMCMTAAIPASEGRAHPVDVDAWSAAIPPLRSAFARAAEAGGHYDVFQTLRVPQWVFGRVALVGDAAHGMTPALGQGAGCSIMNAYMLAASVHEAGDVDRGLSRWEALMRPITQKTQDYCEGLTEDQIPHEGRIWTDASLYTARLNPLTIGSGIATI